MNGTSEYPKSWKYLKYINICKTVPTQELRSPSHQQWLLSWQWQCRWWLWLVPLVFVKIIAIGATGWMANARKAPYRSWVRGSLQTYSSGYFQLYTPLPPPPPQRSMSGPLGDPGPGFLAELRADRRRKTPLPSSSTNTSCILTWSTAATNF